mgnify:FL=1
MRGVSRREREREREHPTMRRSMFLGTFPSEGWTKFDQSGKCYSELQQQKINLQNNIQKTYGIAWEKKRFGDEKTYLEYGARNNRMGSIPSNGGNTTGVTPLSLYNKEKWLPICRDLPARISHKCCGVMKKSPLGIYQRKNKVKPYIGTMAVESRLRKQAWMRHGCNAFDGNKPQSTPLAFWTEQDVLEYIDKYGLKYATVYGDIFLNESGKYCTTGCDRTGCVYCGYGVHLEKGETRFERLKKTHPKQYDYSVGGGQWIDNPDYDPDYDGEPDQFGWIEWNPPKLWVPSKEGLGFGRLFDMANEIMEQAGYKTMWRY